MIGKHFLRQSTRYFVAVFCGFAVTFGVASLISARKGLGTEGTSPCLASVEQPFSVPRTNLGYDFSSASARESDGNVEVDAQQAEILPLDGFSSRDGTRLERLAARKKLLLLLLVDENSRTIARSIDMVADIHNRVSRAAIPYAVLSLPDDSSVPLASALLERIGFHRSNETPFFESFERLGLEIPTFFWSGRGPEAGLSVDTDRPLHVLVTDSGQTLCSWPGTSESPIIRERMANQIVSDVLWFHAVLANARGGNPEP